MKGLRLLTIVPLLVFLACVATGIGNYQAAKNAMRQDLTHALRRFVLTPSEQQLITDSLSTLQHGRVLTLNDATAQFSSHLSIHSLKDSSHIAICLLRENSDEPFTEEALVSSDTMLWQTRPVNSGDAIVAIKAYANPSFASVLAHSDQRLPLTGMVFCMIMLSFFAWQRHKRQAAIILSASIKGKAQQTPLHLTPMQEQLMGMFDTAPNHTLTKEAICEALWPKKDHPENTLYTFISRLKTSLKAQSGIDIINKRGKEYQLVNKDETH